MAEVFDATTQGQQIGSLPTGSNTAYVCPAEQAALSAVLAAKPAATAHSSSFAAAGPRRGGS